MVGDLREKYDIDVNVSGGGFMSQADAVAMSLARAYVDQVKGADTQGEDDRVQQVPALGRPEADGAEEVRRTGRKKEDDRRATGDTELLVPIRCFTCGKLIGDKFNEFESEGQGRRGPRQGAGRPRHHAVLLQKDDDHLGGPDRPGPPLLLNRRTPGPDSGMQIQDVRVRVCFNGRGDLGIEADVIVDGKLGRALSPSGASRGGERGAPVRRG